MSLEEILSWEEDGIYQLAHVTLAYRSAEDHIMFFQYEAEYQCWQEQVEIKHAEFHRGLKYFMTF
jgi:hypothetical protein